MHDEEASIDDLVISLLQLFAEGQPLEREALEAWRLKEAIPATRIKKAAGEALARQWIKMDSSNFLYLTMGGSAKVVEQELFPPIKLAWSDVTTRPERRREPWR
jgi:hypothetical protein